MARRAAVVHAEAAGSRPLRLETEHDTLVGEWDPVGLGRVVDNLLSNAIKYSPDSPEAEIRLRLRMDGDAAVLSVRDHGRGIPERERGRVFERFFRASNAAATPGTGGGLAAARQIVEEMGGRLSFVSWEGEGTEFTVTLPMGGG